MDISCSTLGYPIDLNFELRPHIVLPLGKGELWHVVDAPLDLVSPPKFTLARSGDGVRVPLFPYRRIADTQPIVSPIVIGFWAAAGLKVKPKRLHIVDAGELNGDPNRYWIGLAVLEDR